MRKKYIFIPNQTLTLRDAKAVDKAVDTALTAFMDGTEEALVLGLPGKLIAMDEDGSLELADVDIQEVGDWDEMIKNLKEA